MVGRTVHTGVWRILIGILIVAAAGWALGQPMAADASPS